MILKLVLEKNLHLQLLLVLLSIIQDFSWLLRSLVSRLTRLNSPRRYVYFGLLLLHFLNHLICIRVQNSLVDVWDRSLRSLAPHNKGRRLLYTLRKVLVSQVGVFFCLHSEPIILLSCFILLNDALRTFDGFLCLFSNLLNLQELVFDVHINLN